MNKLLTAAVTAAVIASLIATAALAQAPERPQSPVLTMGCEEVAFMVTTDVPAISQHIYGYMLGRVHGTPLARGMSTVENSMWQLCQAAPGTTIPELMDAILVYADTLLDEKA